MEYIRPIGFSTGSLCGSDFQSAVETLKHTSVTAIELSALREPELHPLLAAIREIPLKKYAYVSIHAPSAISKYTERELVVMLRESVPRRFPVIVHADVIRDARLWTELGTQLCLENMDKRKPTGRTIDEMRPLFDSLSEASLCLDLAHARQVDPSLNETVRFLVEFSSRLQQVHVSELNSASRHEQLSFAGARAVQAIRDLIPPETPLILEHAAEPHEIDSHLGFVSRILERAQPTLVREVG